MGCKLQRAIETPLSGSLLAVTHVPRELRRLHCSGLCFYLISVILLVSFRPQFARSRTHVYVINAILRLLNLDHLVHAPLVGYLLVHIMILLSWRVFQPNKLRKSLQVIEASFSSTACLSPKLHATKLSSPIIKFFIISLDNRQEWQKYQPNWRQTEGLGGNCTPGSASARQSVAVQFAHL